MVKTVSRRRVDLPHYMQMKTVSWQRAARLATEQTKTVAARFNREDIAPAPFSMVDVPVTNKQWESVMGVSAYAVQPDMRPRVFINRAEAKVFCAKLSAEVGVEFRLPTNLEWDLAAHPFESSVFPWGNEEWNVYQSMIRKGGIKAGWHLNGLELDELQIGRLEREEKEANLAALRTMMQDKAVFCADSLESVLDRPWGRSPFGILQLAGNIWEMTSDVEDKMMVVRGGSFLNTRIERLGPENKDLRTTTERTEDLGFRIVTNAEVVPQSGDSALYID
ncbi:MAG: SUMF1/EgtB/PvdO family nonheme iron enzyme [Candidatus Margulisiibacteriota bacterium]